MIYWNIVFMAVFQQNGLFISCYNETLRNTMQREFLYNANRKVDLQYKDTCDSCDTWRKKILVISVIRGEKKYL